MFTIGKVFHLTQVVDDLDEADAWYDRVFAPFRNYRGYMAEAVRVASAFCIGDHVNELVQLADVPGAHASPIGRFRARFGSRFHSIAWFVDDVGACYRTLSDHGVRTVDVAGRRIVSDEHAVEVGYIWTHPKDSYGLLEFGRSPGRFGVDPRYQAFWPTAVAYWRDVHPLGLSGPLGLTFSVSDPDGAAIFYEEVLGATRVPSDAGHAFAVGETTTVELLDKDSDPALRAFGEGIFGATFHSVDLERAAAHLAAVGVVGRRRDGDSAIVIDAEQALGATITLAATSRVT
jgi:catechol 2,3-dioxygenase-like lactoylglutathione lyase family enzyme